MAAWNQTSELVIGGGGQVYVADALAGDAPAPTNATAAPGAGFHGMGFLTDDGVTFSV